MKMEDGMLLFHGSYTPVERIDLSMCADGKDFGRGFYLTPSAEQAKGFIRASVLKARRFRSISAAQDFGYVSSFIYHRDGLKVYEFERANREWLWFIVQNRRPSLSRRLEGKVSPEAFQADVVIGKVANDRTNPTITTYLNDLYGDIYV